MSGTLRMITADVPGRGQMYYLIDSNYDFIRDAKEFLDWKAATNRAPATMKAYCSRLLWYYRFLLQRNLSVLETTPADLTEFVIWLSNPYRDAPTVSAIHQPSPLTAVSVNLILQALEEAEQQHRLAPSVGAADKAKDQVIAALRRRLDEMKQQNASKDQELRGKQREIDLLYGKLAAASPLH